MTLSIGRIPPDLSAKLIEEYLEIKKRFAMNDWGPGQLKGGRFAEVVLRIHQHLLSDSVTPFGVDIPAAEKTRILNRVTSEGTIDDHIRQKTVPLVRLLLDFRNNRDAAHLGGFDANSMDTHFVLTTTTWILCEFVRVYGGYAMSQAQEIVDGLSAKEYPVIIERQGELFIARHDLTAKQEVLVLLSRSANASAAFLESKVGDSNKSRFRRNLREMVDEKLIGQAANGDYFVLPRGQALVTKNSLLTYRP
ncbi:hypothetical protein JJC00_26370 [Bradyrhizobium diazoefficiens]|uniref:hypothetical protein n=1 Tax=Bradyrhizobium diazoefficiens TaxID=1355477 RepID=UPI0019091E94|nr:hypothetical protein [Bradyrhizobium diazoefficiens]QQO32098.1 hypothetical protein JJC00_26370 [Bradyrhizobium diazoefficiens]